MAYRYNRLLLYVLYELTYLLDQIVISVSGLKIQILVIGSMYFSFLIVLLVVRQHANLFLFFIIYI